MRLRRHGTYAGLNVKAKLFRLIRVFAPHDWMNLYVFQARDRTITLSFSFNGVHTVVKLGRWNIIARVRYMARAWEKYEADLLKNASSGFIIEKLCERSFASQIFKMRLVNADGTTSPDPEDAKHEAYAKRSRSNSPYHQFQIKQTVYRHHIMKRWSIDGVPYVPVPPPKPAGPLKPGETFFDRLFPDSFIKQFNKSNKSNKPSEAK